MITIKRQKCTPERSLMTPGTSNGIWDLTVNRDIIQTYSFSSNIECKKKQKWRINKESKRFFKLLTCSGESHKHLYILDIRLY